MDELNAARKKCSACGDTKGSAEFNKRARSIDGLQAWCRDCDHEYAAKRRSAKAEQERARGRRWRAANPERARAATRRQYAVNPGRRRRSSQDYRKRNPDKAAQQNLIWRKANAEYLKVYGRRRRKENPWIAREHVRRRRARKLANGPVERFADAEIAARDNWTCGLCHLPIDCESAWPAPGSLVIDHIVPLALGGTHTRANVQAAHCLCNGRKGARLAA